MKQNKCIFCQIVKNNSLAKAQMLFQSKYYFVMLSLHPQIEGHTLFIPKVHYSSLKGIPNKTQGFLFQETVKIAEKLKNSLKARAYTIRVNNELYLLEKDDKMHIGHVHFHIIPRYKKEEKLIEEAKEATPEALLITKRKILRNAGTIKEL